MFFVFIIVLLKRITRSDHFKKYNKMSIQIIPKDKQASGQFNGGQIIENKPIGFPQEGGTTKPYSNLFYWAYAKAVEESTIGLHPHQGFEIMSFVLNGAIRHYDTKLKEWRSLSEGDVQIIRAGNGISHAEHMEKDAVMFQIWVDPNLHETLSKEASYDDYKKTDFPVKEDGDVKFIDYNGVNAPLKMDAPGLHFYRLEFLAKADYKKEIKENLLHSIYVLEGEAKINGQEMAQKDDFIIISDSSELNITGSENCKLFVIASKEKIDYKTYAERMRR
jgi:redox-sensitive bicupin YhaK (pirin superfamily)